MLTSRIVSVIHQTGHPNEESTGTLLILTQADYYSLQIPLLFHKGGFTGGVFTSRGKTVTPGQHALERNIDKEKTLQDGEEQVEEA